MLLILFVQQPHSSCTGLEQQLHILPKDTASFNIVVLFAETEVTVTTSDECDGCHGMFPEAKLAIA